MLMHGLAFDICKNQLSNDEIQRPLHAIKELTQAEDLYE